MPKVLFHIPIRSGMHGKSWLMETYYDLDFLPNEGELFHPLKNDSESGLSMEVRHRWWGEDGNVAIETHTYIMEPDKDLDFHMHNIYCQWNVGRDGNLVEMLKQNGWWEYGKMKPAQEEIDGRLGEAFKLVRERLEQGVVSVNEIRRYLFGEDNRE